MRNGFKIFVCLLLCLSLLPALPAFADEDDPVQVETAPAVSLTISNVEDFLAFGDACRLDSYSHNLIVELKADLDLTGMDFSGVPIFCGTFHGNGHTVSGLNITGDGSHQGLFRYLEGTAVVTDLKVTGTVTPGGSRSQVGGIAGFNAGTVENCQFSGEVSGADSVGGMVGVNALTGIVSDCRAEGSVHGEHFVGGIAGENKGVVRGCENYALVNTTAKQNDVSVSDITIGTLTGSESVVTVTDIGGIAGNSTGIIRDCENRGDVGYQHMGYNIGGIAGTQSGYITESENFANVRGRKEVGGIVGQMEPSTELRFQEDTLQILKEQLDTLSGLTGRAAANAQSSSAKLNSELLKLKDQTETARSALDILLPKDGSLPDVDSILAAQSTLSDSLSDMSRSLNQIAAISQNTVTTLSSDLLAIGSQVQAMSVTLSGATENLNASFTDVSDSDTDADTAGKVERCSNHGSVLADWNVGGIAGAVAMENDLDIQEDLDIIGNSSLNFFCDARAVVLRCENGGTVTGKKENAGGIAGWVSMGLVKECKNTGAIEAEEAENVGGIAGSSEGFIRQCTVKAFLSGACGVGGVAGSGKTVTDCLTMVKLLTGNEKLGAVLGTAQEDTEVSDNYYLIVDEDIGGIDGISYCAVAQPLAEQEFFCLEELPEAFRSHTLRFVFADGTEGTRTVVHGEALAEKDIPALPEVDGSEGRWESDNDVDLSRVTFDCLFTAAYSSRIATLKSRQTRENGQPVLLCQGSFSLDAQIEAQQGNAPEELSALECWEFSVPGDNAQVTLRYLPPENTDAEDYTVLVRTAEGTWEEKASRADGSYLVFAVANGEDAFCIVQTPKNHTVIILAAVLAAMAGAAVIVWRIRRKKKA